MEKAKAAVSSFINRAGHHDTTVDESVAPGVTREEIKPTRHEEVQEAIDREVHQDHYHTTVQPVQHQEVLPEQHTHQMAPVQNQEFEHDNASQTRQKLESEAGRFKDTSTIHETQHTTGVAPRVEGEHVHHHVHENVQPVVHKETIKPEVVHTTVPIHEVHRAEAEHHGTSVLPVKNLEDFTAGGGTLTGGGHSARETYEGDPKAYNSAMQVDRTDADTNFKAHDGLHDHQRALGSGGAETATSGPHSSNMVNKLDPRVESDRSGLGTTGAGTGTGQGIGSNSTGTDINSQNRVDPRVDARGGPSLPTGHEGTGAAAGGAATAGAYEVDKHHETGRTGVGDTAETTSGPHSSNLENKLDPRVDSDGSNNQDHKSSRSGIVGSSNNDTTTGTGPTQNNTDRSIMSDNPDTGNTAAPHASDIPNETDARDQAPGADENGAGNAKGQDPSVVDDKGRKLTGTGAPGSHSALFGLTPDGHKETDVDFNSSKPRPADSGEDSTAASGDGATSSGDTGSRAPAGSGVHEQLDDPRVGEKGHGDNDTTTDESAGKPGAGSSLSGPSQGTGEVGTDA